MVLIVQTIPDRGSERAAVAAGRRSLADPVRGGVRGDCRPIWSAFGTRRVTRRATCRRAGRRR